MLCPACRTENSDQAAACQQCGQALAAPTAAALTVDLRTGALFHSRYEILGPLGRGGMGMVYRAHDRTLDEVVAIKILRPDFASDPKMAERFKSEIRMARKIRHKNVCAIHDFGEDRGVLYISMEYIAGTDLKQRLRQGAPFPSEEALSISIQVADGLAAVHDAGIVHRDLKTPNIMLDSHGTARLMDFGIAKQVGVESTLTATGNIVGTPEYMSPEQAQGLKVDRRSDLYALGIVIYEIYTGTTPFKAETPVAIILKHLNEPPPLESAQAAGIPREVKAILRKALAKDPNQRYDSAEKMAHDLRLAQQSTLQVLPPTAAMERTAPPQPGARRNLLRILILTLALGLVLVLGVIGLGVFFSSLRNPQALPNSPGPLERVTPAEISPAPMPSPSRSAQDLLAESTTPRQNPTPEPARTLTTLPMRTPVPAPSRATLAIAAPTSAPSLIPINTPQPTSEPGLLHVVVQPWGSVIVDGREIGETPLDKLTLPAGTHHVRIRNPRWEIIEKEVVILPRQTTRIAIDFPKDGIKKTP
jgi:serine/threonine protein kinase